LASFNNISDRGSSLFGQVARAFDTEQDFGLKFRFGNMPEEQKEAVELAAPASLADPTKKSGGEGWQRIHSPSWRFGYAFAGLVGLAFIFVLLAWLIVVSVFIDRSGIGNSGVVGSDPWGAVVLALLLFIPVHELVHALWLPGMGLSSHTVMVIWPKKLRFGVYYEGCMTRGRWLMMRIAPFLFLTVIPVVLLTLFEVIPASYTLVVFLQVLFLLNGIGSGGDVVAVIWLLFQVPTRTQICFRNGKAYWRLAT
jgi:hypothetical protein